jgi:hypothetical protein
MYAASGQFMQSGGDFPDGSSESVYGSDDQVVALPKPANAFGPTRSVTTGAPRGGVGEYPVGDNSCSRNCILLLVDGLLSGGDAKVGSNAQGIYNGKSPIINPVSDPGKIGFSCDTEKSDSMTSSYSVPAPYW